MLESAATLVQEYADLEAQLADPAVHSDQDLVRRLNKRYAALAPTVAAYHAWHAARDDAAAARELAVQDKAFAEELPTHEAVEAAAEEKLRRLLVPRDPDDERDIILEVKAGEGGEESAQLFLGSSLDGLMRGQLFGERLVLHGQLTGRSSVIAGRVPRVVRRDGRCQRGIPLVQPAHEVLVGVDRGVSKLSLEVGVL